MTVTNTDPKTDASRKPRDDEVDFVGVTHTGKVRATNQDHFLICSLRKGVEVHDMGKELDFTPKKAVGIGALAMGNIKYKVHYHMFQMMRDTDKPLYLDHDEAFKVAREYAAK